MSVLRLWLRQNLHALRYGLRPDIALWEAKAAHLAYQGEYDAALAVIRSKRPSSK